MKISHVLGTLAIAAFVSTNVSATPIVFNNLSAANIVNPGGGTSQWTSGILDLSGDNVVIGPATDATVLILHLDGTVTTAVGVNNNYAAGISVNPFVAAGAEIFGFTYQLRYLGALVGSEFGFDLLNPFADPQGDVSTGTSGAPAGITFDEVDVSIYNLSLTESVSSFQVFLGVPDSVPDVSSTVVLLFLGMLAIAGFDFRKKMVVSRN